MAFDFSTGLQGAAGGAGVGSMFGPWGTGIGAGVGFLTGAFSGSSSPNFSSLQDLINQRQQQINSFAQQLTQAQNNVMSNYQNLGANTLNRLTQNFTANLAGRGLSPSGGAMASASANAAAGMQGQYDALNANMTQQNLGMINQAQSGLFGPALGIGQMQTLIPWEQRMGQQQALGEMFGQMAGAGWNRYLNPGTQPQTQTTGSGSPFDYQPRDWQSGPWR